jgi:hypothetical protein
LQHFQFQGPPNFTQSGIFGLKRNHLATLAVIVSLLLLSVRVKLAWPKMPISCKCWIWLQNYIPKYKTTHLGTKLHTLVQNYIPWYKTPYLGTKLHTLVQNSIPWYKIIYLSTKLHT